MSPSQQSGELRRSDRLRLACSKHMRCKLRFCGGCRNGGQQFVRVEHVHIHDGGKAIIGNVQKRDEQQRTT
jgi:hypothetical protein